jgi:hypothetical protein
MVVGPVTPLKLRSGFVPFETFQSSKLGLSWNFGTGKVGQLVREASSAGPGCPKHQNRWIYGVMDTAHLLNELAGIREMILRVPITLQTKSALQSAIDRIWRVEEDVRFLLSLQRDMQASLPAEPLSSSARLKTRL